MERRSGQKKGQKKKRVDHQERKKKWWEWKKKPSVTRGNFSKKNEKADRRIKVGESPFANPGTNRK